MRSLLQLSIVLLTNISSSSVQVNKSSRNLDWLQSCYSSSCFTANHLVDVSRDKRAFAALFYLPANRSGNGINDWRRICDLCSSSTGSQHVRHVDAIYDVQGTHHFNGIYEKLAWYAVASAAFTIEYCSS